MDTNLALLIDFENIAAGTEKERLGRFDINAIMSRLVDKGRILIARSYADWGRFSRFKQSLLAANVTMYELTSHGMQDKNRADIAMVVDALELAFTKDYIQTFVIVSGDSDFTPLVLKMRELDKRVIGIGTRSSTSRLLVNACDEFIFYDTIVKTKARATRHKRDSGGKGRKQWAFDLLVDSLSGLQRENPQAPLASIVKNAMRRKSSDFSESELGFPSFAKFLESAADSGYIVIERDRKAGGYRVDSADTRGNDSADDDDDGSTSDFVDTYLPEKVEPYTSPLTDAGIHPMSHPLRMQILQLIEATAKERGSKRRKVNVQFLREDVRKRLRKTFPDVPSRMIRGLFTALMEAGLLIHKDGTAIRSASAAFHLEKNAEGLNRALMNHYLSVLEEANADLHDADKLAELFLGDSARRRDVEEALAWLSQGQGEETEAGLNDIDLDDLLVLEEAPAKKAEPVKADAPAKKPAAKKPAAKKPAAKKPAAKKPAAKKATIEDDGALDDLDAALSEDADAKKPAAKKPRTRKAPAKKTEETEEAPKRAPRKRTRKKAEPEAAEATEAAAEEKPKPKARTTRTRKKPAAKAEASAEDAPKPTPRKRTRKKVEEPPAADEGNDLDLDALLS